MSNIQAAVFVLAEKFGGYAVTLVADAFDQMAQHVGVTVEAAKLAAMTTPNGEARFLQHLAICDAAAEAALRELAAR